MSDLIDDIKVEVQLPSEPGDNLITNTSGQYGAWQWAPSSGTSGLTITGDPAARTITATRNATAGYTSVVSDYLPATPGKYANARIDLLALTSGHKVTMALQFYKSDYSVISWQYSSPSSTLTTLGFSSVSIPANTAYMQIFVIMDKTADPLPGSGSANASASFKFTKAMVTELSTSGVPSVVTTNLVPNGSFQSTTAGWTAGTNVGSVSRVQNGSQWYLRATLTNGVTLSSGEYSYVNGPYLAVTAGANYSLRIDTSILGPSSGHSFTTGVLYKWYNNSDVQIGSNVYLTDNSTDAGWHQVWKILTVPAGATKIRLFPFMRHSGPQAVFSNSWYFQVDSVALVKSSVLTTYFDGYSPNTSNATYAWTGTVGNSPSTRTSVGAVDYVEPDEQFFDISGGYNNFTVERDELDISTLTGTIVDPGLSPARADSVVVPGRGIRVSALRPQTGAFERLFTGTIGTCSVEYDPLEDEKRKAVNISISATGMESQLAQASRSGVSIDAAGLAYLSLAQAGVPWVVDGSTGITPASSVATNDSATALDQVALTRDTVGGIAWVDPAGVLRFETTPSTKSTGPNTMGPDDYSATGLKVGFSTDNLVNSVNVTRIIRASDGSTEERVEGQTYEDPASIRKWGRHSVDLTIASTPNATTDAKTAAERLLAGNANPTLAIEELVINSADWRSHAFHDLFDRVTVTAETIDGEVVKALRITRIKHEFTTERRPGGGRGRWHTTYGFTVAGTVASPAIQPPVSAPKSNAWPWLHLSKNGSTFSVPHNTTVVPSGWNIVYNQGFGTVSGSSVVIQRAGWYQVDFAGILFASGGSGRRLARIMLNGGEWARTEFGSSDSSNDTLEVSKIIYAAEGDTISGEVLQTSGGGALNLNGNNPRFSVFLLKDA